MKNEDIKYLVDYIPLLWNENDTFLNGVIGAQTLRTIGMWLLGNMMTTKDMM